MLIVEDSRIVARDIERQLQRLGHEVVATTALGEEALQLAERFQPDLVLMDIRLQGVVDGIQAAQQIRDGCRIPVIYLTAYADDETLQRASVTEPLGYLLKPFEDSQLRTAVEMALHKHATERKLRESERRFAVTLSSIADGIIATDGAGRVTFMNPVAEALTGWTSQEGIGKSVGDIFRLVQESSRLAAEDPAAKVIRLDAAGAGLGDTILLARDGREVPVDESTAPIVDDRGLVIGAVIAFRDVRQKRKAAQADALRTINSRFELALRGSDTGVWDFELPDGALDGKLAYHNFNTWELLGYVAETQSVLSDRAALWHPEDRERANRAIDDCLVGQASGYDIEIRTLHKDGTYRWMNARSKVVRNKSGKPVRLLGTTTNIHARKVAEEGLREANARVDRALRGSNVCIWELDLTPGTAHPTAAFFSNLWEQLGYQSGEAVTDFKAILALVHPDDLPAVVSTTRAYLAGQTTEYETEIRVRRRDGIYRWMLTRATVLRDEQCRPIRLTACTVDITERKALEEKLLRAKESAEGANRAKDEFLANVSHEIRTPMNAILGMTELVLDTPLNQGQLRSLRTVKSAAGSLLGTIDDLLDFSKIEAGKLELDPAPFALRPALREIMGALSLRAHRKGLELIVDVQPEVPDALVGDGGRLRQILLNLVGNAVKFTPRGEVILRVELAASGVDPFLLRFAVRDTGVGIPSHKQEIIFRAFEQEDTSTTRKYGGTGLGLTIAARLARLLGGQIVVTSGPGTGSVFAFSAAFAPQPEPLAASLEATLEATLPDFADLRILVVDDNRTNRLILESWLRQLRMDPEGVTDGAAVRDILEQASAAGRPFAIVLLDDRLLDADGVTVAAWIRERDDLAETRIVLLTSADRAVEVSRLRQLRVNAQLSKPVMQAELVAAIHWVMTRPKDDVSQLVQAVRVAPPAQMAEEALPRKRILVAEDNDFNALVIEQLLIKHGYRAYVTNSGEETILLAETGKFDLLLLDLHMPDMDGLQIVRALRAREAPSCKRLPVIAVTARSRSEDRDLCLAAGMDDFLAKPILAHDLLIAIERATGAVMSEGSLLSPHVLLGACGEDPRILEKLCVALRNHLPAEMLRLEAAVRARDTDALRKVAHRVAGMVSPFSITVGDVASKLEEQAAVGNLDENSGLMDRLNLMTRGLLVQTSTVSLEGLYEACGNN